jgi:hypothetical protein
MFGQMALGWVNPLQRYCLDAHGHYEQCPLLSFSLMPQARNLSEHSPRLSAYAERSHLLELVPVVLALQQGQALVPGLVLLSLLAAVLVQALLLRNLRLNCRVQLTA